MHVSIIFAWLYLCIKIIFSIPFFFLSDYVLLVGEPKSRIVQKHTFFAPEIGRRLRAKFWPDCAIPDTSMKFGTVVDHD